MKDLHAVRGRYRIQRLVDEGEHQQQDFKFLISDARKIARSVSAFANRDGGRLLIGVKDNGTIAGVRNEEDVYVVEQAAQRYCRPAQEVKFEAFKVDAGVVVIVATIERTDKRPVRVLEQDGRVRAYYRVADENIAAHPLLERAWELQAAETTAPVMSLDGATQSVLTAVDAATDGLEPELVARQAHVSERTAADILARMMALGVLELRYERHRFVLHRAE